MLELRGQRYLPGCDPDLVEFVTKRLQFLDFLETSTFYDHVSQCQEGGTLTDSDLAFLGCNDRYFLLTAILHRKDALHPWLFDRCREVEADPDGYLDLWARYHYKSTIITYAGTIQDIICDPDMTQCIFSVSQHGANKFLTQIKETLERNQLLKHLYADVLYQNPRKESPRWSVGKGIVVRRSAHNTKKEATVEAFGLVEGLPAGPHFEKLLYDDTVTQKSVTNPEMIAKVSEHEELSDNLGVGETTRKQYVGTRYLHGDTYQQIIDRGDVKIRTYPATDNGKLNGNPVFLTKTAWAKVKRTQKKVVAAQHLMNPAAGSEASFDVLTFRPYLIRPSILNVYIMADPSKGATRKSDRTAIAVIGVDANKNKYLLDGFRHRMTLSERWVNLHTMYKRWYHMPGVQHCEVGYEQYGMQSDIEHFKLEMLKKDYLTFPIKELAWPREGDHSKVGRVERLEPDFKNSMFYFPGIVWHPDYSDVRNDKHTLWNINPETLEIDFRRMEGETRMMRQIRQQGQPWRIVQPVVRHDEDDRVYDLTRTAIEELRFFPFGSHDDLADIISRVYDMNPLPPAIHESNAAELPTYPDA
ncbi:MAG: hypothetical protein GY938_24555 [Ketobacter sp.]|nr:hypothetical protein [Ketobacter sp.]